MIRLILFLVVSVMAAGGTSMAENSSICSVDTVPIQIIRGVEHGPVTAFSDTNIGDYPAGFTAFVAAVTEHVAAKLGQEKLCLNSPESRERSLLQFVSWSITSSYSASLTQLEATPSSVCRISSPWIDITVEREPVPSVRAIVRFSERQLLADQAVLAGAHNVPPGLAMPFGNNEFEQYANLAYAILEYAHSEIRHWPARKSVEKRVPPDLLWLFRRSWQAKDGSFTGAAKGAMRNAMKTGSEGYTKIVIALIDQCFESGGARIQYNSILDVAGLIPLEQYKIVTSIVSKPTRPWIENPIQPLEDIIN